MVSIVGRTPLSALNASVSCESIKAPEAWPTAVRLLAESAIKKLREVYGHK